MPELTVDSIRDIQGSTTYTRDGDIIIIDEGSIPTPGSQDSDCGLIEVRNHKPVIFPGSSSIYFFVRFLSDYRSLGSGPEREARTKYVARQTLNTNIIKVE